MELQVQTDDIYLSSGKLGKRNLEFGTEPYCRKINGGFQYALCVLWSAPMLHYNHSSPGLDDDPSSSDLLPPHCSLQRHLVCSHPLPVLANILVPFHVVLVVPNMIFFNPPTKVRPWPVFGHLSSVSPPIRSQVALWTRGGTFCNPCNK